MDSVIALGNTSHLWTTFRHEDQGHKCPPFHKTLRSRLTGYELRVPRCPILHFVGARSRASIVVYCTGHTANCSHAEAPWERVRGRIDVHFLGVKATKAQQAADKIDEGMKQSEARQNSKAIATQTLKSSIYDQ